MTRVLYHICFLLVISSTSFSQTSINDYKYIIIPTQYEFLKEKDQYQLNSLTKFLFNKYGYEAYLQNEDFPEDLRNNRCLGLLADIIRDNGLFKTKLQIDLKDCNENVVISSKEGESREKEFSKAYNLALRDAFTTFQNLNYAYQPNQAILTRGGTTKSVDNATEQQEIERLKKELNTLKETQKESVLIGEPIPVAVTLEVIEEKSKAEDKVAQQSKTTSKSGTVLYAQSIENGFQLVDSSPKVVMILYKTAAKDVFTVKDKNAIVFKKDDQWFYSENDGETVKETQLNIKF